MSTDTVEIAVEMELHLKFFIDFLKYVHYDMYPYFSITKI